MSLLVTSGLMQSLYGPGANELVFIHSKTNLIIICVIHVYFKTTQFAEKKESTIFTRSMYR